MGSKTSAADSHKEKKDSEDIPLKESILKKDNSLKIQFLNLMKNYQAGV